MSAADIAAERAAIRTERRNIDVRDAATRAECFRHFVVTPCLEAARDERMQALKAVTAREVTLGDVERQQRAQRRLDRIDAASARRAAAASEAAANQPAPHDDEPRARPAPQPGKLRGNASAGSVAPTDTAPRRDKADRAKEQQASRVEDIERRQNAAALRRQQRAASGKPPAKPLPPVEATP